MQHWRDWKDSTGTLTEELGYRSHLNRQHTSPRLNIRAAGVVFYKEKQCDTNSKECYHRRPELNVKPDHQIANPACGTKDSQSILCSLEAFGKETSQREARLVPANDKACKPASPQECNRPFVMHMLQA